MPFDYVQKCRWVSTFRGLFADWAVSIPEYSENLKHSQENLFLVQFECKGTNPVLEIVDGFFAPHLGQTNVANCGVRVECRVAAHWNALIPTRLAI